MQNRSFDIDILSVQWQLCNKDKGGLDSKIICTINTLHENTFSHI
jgi:hypothetical protein